jgi:hypothetical protein
MWVVEYKLAMMKGVPLHSHWHKLSLVRLKNKTTKLLVCVLMFWDFLSGPDLRKFFRIPMAIISLMESL